LWRSFVVRVKGRLIEAVGNTPNFFVSTTFPHPLR
jgi:hypothetical protein